MCPKAFKNYVLLSTPAKEGAENCKLFVRVHSSSTWDGVWTQATSPSSSTRILLTGCRRFTSDLGSTWPGSLRTSCPHTCMCPRCDCVSVITCLTSWLCRVKLSSLTSGGSPTWQSLVSPTWTAALWGRGLPRPRGRRRRRERPRRGGVRPGGTQNPAQLLRPRRGRRKWREKESLITRRTQNQTSLVLCLRLWAAQNVGLASPPWWSTSDTRKSVNIVKTLISILNKQWMRRREAQPKCLILTVWTPHGRYHQKKTLARLRVSRRRWSPPPASAVSPAALSSAPWCSMRNIDAFAYIPKIGKFYTFYTGLPLL